MPKGGSTTSKVEIPAWLEEAAKSAIGQANTTSKIGYTPYYGPDVAALTPQEIASMQGTNTAAAAFGMPTSDVTAGLPTAQNYNGVSGYSSGPMYDAALAELKARRPGQYNAISSMFIDPVTGQLTDGSDGDYADAAGAADTLAPIMHRPDGSGRDRATGITGGRSTTSMDTIGSYAPGGVNTRNPNSPSNRFAASLSGPQRQPTAADRPISRSSAAGGGSGGMGGGK